MPIENHVEVGKIPAMHARRRIAEVPSVEMPCRPRRSNLRSIQDGSRGLRTVLRDHRSGVSGRLVQSVLKCIRAGDRMGSTA
jgi:hypothetical protein